jgi:hypothetical protein
MPERTLSGELTDSPPWLTPPPKLKKYYSKKTPLLSIRDLPETKEELKYKTPKPSETLLPETKTQMIPILTSEEPYIFEQPKVKLFLTLPRPISKTSTYHSPTIPGGFLVDSWLIPGFLVDSLFIRSIPRNPNIFLSYSFIIP